MCKDNPRCSAHSLPDEASRLAQIHDRISTFGFTKVGVLRPAPFMYTVGLTVHGLHELIADGNPSIVGEALEILARGAMDQPEHFGPDRHVSIDNRQGERFLIHLGASTSTNLERAAYARDLYAGQHAVQVLHVFPAHSLGWAGYTGATAAS